MAALVFNVLILFFPTFPFDPPENIGKKKVKIGFMKHFVIL